MILVVCCNKTEPQIWAAQLRFQTEQISLLQYYALINGSALCNSLPEVRQSQFILDPVVVFRSIADFLILSFVFMNTRKCTRLCENERGTATEYRRCYGSKHQLWWRQFTREVIGFLYRDANYELVYVLVHLLKQGRPHDTEELTADINVWIAANTYYCLMSY